MSTLRGLLGGGVFLVAAACGDGDRALSNGPRSTCGNGLIEPGEECDDGNLDEGDQCSAVCTRGMLGVNVTIKTCPTIQALSVVPGRISPNEEALVSVQAEDRDGDAFSVRWVATSGTFRDAFASLTQYTCAEPGTPVLAVSVHDELCGESATIGLECLPP